MRTRVIISTIKKKLDSISPSTSRYENITVINQNPINRDKSIYKDLKKNVEWVEFDAVGLSRSRNLAVNMIRKEDEFVYLTDDDIVLAEKFSDIIEQNFDNNPDYDVLAFQVEGIEEKYKEYKSKEKKIGFYRSLKLSSVEIVFRANVFVNNNVFYDERFGSGAKYKMGEENIILFDLLRKGIKIKYIPEKIADLHIKESSWFEGFTEEYFYNRGATYKRMFGRMAWFFLLLFCLRKYHMYKDEIKLKNAVTSSLRGMNSI